MRNQNHLDSLTMKHRKLEERISQELARPMPDGFTLQRLKRQRLLVKDAIESWERILDVVRAKAPRHTIPPEAGAQEGTLAAAGR